MSEKETPQNEEVDLGQLYKMIGNMFSKLFNFIGKSLKFSFHYLILMLLFIKQHLLKIIIATSIGGLIGFGLDFKSPTEYSYDMIIEPNYGSVDQIFEKMEYYNELVIQEDSSTLSNLFNISFSDANNLAGFQLTPYETDKDKILAYDQFIRTTDTLTQKHFTFKDFVGDGTSKFDSKRYVYRIVSFDPNVKINNFRDKILEEIESNPTIQKKKRIQLNKIQLDSIATREELRQIDSLRALYKEVTMLELENNKLPNASTYVDLSGDVKGKNNDIELFNISKTLNQKLIDIESLKETSEDILNVITVFNPRGRELGTFYDKNIFIVGRFFMFLMIGFILLKELNSYLTSYQKKY